MKKSYTLLILFVLKSFITFSQELVKDINTGMNASSPNIIGEVPGGFIFYANSPGTGAELWFSDGTSGGTKLLEDINTGTPSSNISTFYVKINSSWYFIAGHTSVKWSLWKSDGTDSGTMMIKDLGNISISNPLIQMTAHNSELYFAFDDPSSGMGKELWKTDGTINGTAMVKNIHPSASSNPSGFASFGNYLYFFADDGSVGNELWKTDGTETGTTLVKDIFSGPVGSFPFSVPSLMVFKNKLYFGAQGTHDDGVELWVTDGTSGGTSQLININTTVGASSYPALLLATADFLFMRASDGSTGNELWATDGTLSGTRLLKDISPGSAGSTPVSAVPINGKVVFSASSPSTGSELWATDGTPGGTEMLKDIYAGTGNGYPSKGIAVSGHLMFSATDSVNGSELWVTNGTQAGTKLYQDINPGAQGSSPVGLFYYNSEIYLSARIDKDAVGNELYKLSPNFNGLKNIGTQGFTEVYPNPCFPGTDIHFTNTTGLGFSLSLVSLDGKVIHEQPMDAAIDSWIVPMGTKSGLYILKFQFNKSVLCQLLKVE